MTLETYAGRATRAVALYVTWRKDPEAISVGTRATRSHHEKHGRGNASESVTDSSVTGYVYATPTSYSSAFPIRAGHVVRVANIPYDLSATEADRLAAFVRVLVPA